MIFEVWAPKANRMEIEIDGRRTAMTSCEDGMWRIDLDVPPGTDYAYRIDGGDPLPDPRSPWQPHGVHGPSRTVDHSAFHWTDKGWQAPPLSSAIIYELHVGTFTPEGTFDAIIERLPHLCALGVTHIELMPVAEFHGTRGWGYDGVDLYAPHHAYGGPEGMKRLVNACHMKGMAVIQDVVYNHFGPVGSYVDRFGHYFTSLHSTLWGKAINYDGSHSDPVRHFTVDNAMMWLRDYHVDALRLDDVDAILDTCAIHVIEDISHAVRDLAALTGRHMALMAESNMNNPLLIRAPEMGGFGINAQWNDEFHHALHALLTGECNGYYADFGSIAHMVKALKNAYVYDGIYCRERGRTHGRSPEGFGGHRFLAYSQTHDQVGNRAAGDRLSQLLSPGRQKIAAALVLTSPYIPLLFQGEEWGASTPFQYFVDYEGNPELVKAINEGRRRQFSSFGWDPDAVPDAQALETFQRSKLKWEEAATGRHADMLEWYKQLIRLRRTTPDLTNGRRDLLRAEYDEESRWISLARGAVAVVLNLRDRPQHVRPLSSQTTILLASQPGISATSGGVELPPDAVAILG